jgi:FkbM family methyltransferase
MVGTTLRTTAERSGLGPVLRRTRELVQPAYRRGRLDEQRLEQLIAYLLRPDSVCIDVGANRGAALQHMVRCAPDGRHVAFEPLPHLAAGLRERFPMVDVRNAALANRSGNATFVHVRSREAYSGFRHRPVVSSEHLEEIVVQVERLDDVVGTGCAPALLKIDVEGAELGVLQGAMSTILRARPTVVFEHGKGGADCYGTSPEQIHDLLAGDLGYRVFDMDGAGPYSRERLVETFHRNLRWNFVAHP